MSLIHEPARTTPVADEVDLCVIGGSCTGVFAAVRAARLGARVALIEHHNQFGGVATARMVNVWHPLHDIHGSRQIIGGLTTEVLDRLRHRRALADTDPMNMHGAYIFNSAELAITLDELVGESGIRPCLHTRCVGAAVDDTGRPTAALIEDTGGRRAIRARIFLDASGDAAFLRRLGRPTYRHPTRQPATMAAVLEGLETLRRRDPDFRLHTVLTDPAHPGRLQRTFVWDAPVPPSRDSRVTFATRIHGLDCSDPDQFTAAEIQGRRQVRQMMDLLTDRYGTDAPALIALPACIGIRETCHARTRHRLTEQDLLSGLRHPDAIANGTYPVDLHHTDADGVTLRYLDGTEKIVTADQTARVGRWLAEGAEPAPCYQIPWRSLLPIDGGNVLIAGRLVDADPGAYGAIRVMVNCNQMGEAAGVGAALALESGCDPDAIDTDHLRRTLAEGGSLIL